VARIGEAGLPDVETPILGWAAGAAALSNCWRSRGSRRTSVVYNGPGLGLQPVHRGDWDNVGAPANGRKYISCARTGMATHPDVVLKNSRAPRTVPSATGGRTGIFF